jgi:glycosyltransferase involved in cell wall biosynthesis
MTTPRLAIIVPAYNAAPYITGALDSIARQTPDWQCVVVDDGSADSTEFVLNQWMLRQPPEIFARFAILSSPHLGVAAAINLGVALTFAPWIMACGADDVLDRFYCEILLAALDANPGARVAYSTLAEFGDGARGVWPVKPYARGTLATENCIPGVAIHARALYDAAGGFPEDMPLGGEDWLYWLRAEQLGLLDPPPVWVRDPLYHYRRHAASLSARSIYPNIAGIRERIAAAARGEA